MTNDEPKSVREFLESASQDVKVELASAIAHARKSTAVCDYEAIRKSVASDPIVIDAKGMLDEASRSFNMSKDSLHDYYKDAVSKIANPDTATQKVLLGAIESDFHQKMHDLVHSPDGKKAIEAKIAFDDVISKALDAKGFNCSSAEVRLISDAIESGNAVTKGEPPAKSPRIQSFERVMR